MAHRKRITDKEFAKAVQTAIDRDWKLRESFFNDLEQKIKPSRDITALESTDLIALVCSCWSATLAHLVKTIDKPGDDWRVVLARADSVMASASPLVAASYLASDVDDLRFIAHRWFWWNYCYGELVRRINSQDHFFPCRSCDYKAAGIVELRKHCDQNHPNESAQIKKFVYKLKQCNVCPLRVPNLTEHLKKQHPVELEWMEKRAAAKQSKKPVVLPPRAGKAFALSLWKDEATLKDAIIAALLAHIWIERRNIHEKIQRQRDVNRDVLLPETIEKGWQAYQVTAERYEKIVEMPLWPDPLPTDKAALWDAVLKWLYYSNISEMLGVYGPVLDLKLEKTFDESIINQIASPIQPIAPKKVKLFTNKSSGARMEVEGNDQFNKWTKRSSQPYREEIEDSERVVLNSSWTMEFNKVKEAKEDNRLETVFDAAKADPNPLALLVIKDRSHGDTYAQIADRYNMDEKTVQRIYERTKERLKSIAK